jgi:hypothetical protein
LKCACSDAHFVFLAALQLERGSFGNPIPIFRRFRTIISWAPMMFDKKKHVNQTLQKRRFLNKAANDVSGDACKGSQQHDGPFEN